MVSEVFLTTVEAAKELKVTRVRVWQLIQEGRLAAERVGRDWLIRREVVEAYKKEVV